MLEETQEQLLKLAMLEGLISVDTLAIDATHIEARDQAPEKQEKEKTEPKKRGQKTKSELETWLKQKHEEEEKKPIFEKDIASQLSESFKVLQDQMPLEPQCGIKKIAMEKMSSGMAIKVILQ